MAVTVNGILIPEEKIISEATRLREGYEKYVRENGGEPSEKELREWAEEDLIEAELFRQEADAKFPAPSDERVRQHIAEHVKQYGDLSEQDSVARANGELRTRALMKSLRKGIPQPSEDDVRKYYDDYPDFFVMDETLRLSHVCRYFYPSDKSDLFLELLRVKSELASGQMNWVDVVKQMSDTFSDDGGLFEPVMAGDLPKDIENKLFALKPGEISDVIELGGRSLHLFLLLAKEPPAPLPFKDVKQSITTLLFDQACQCALDAKFDALKAIAVIQREA